MRELSIRNPLVVFIALQIADLLTTLAALALGGVENNPLIGRIMTIGPVPGLLLSKTLVTAIACGGWYLHKYNGIRKANLAFTAIVFWNITIICRLAASAV